MNSDKDNYPLTSLPDDELDETIVPKKTDDENDNNEHNREPSDILNNLDTQQFLNLFNSLKTKDPKDIKKLLLNMGLNEKQIQQMKNTYKNSENESTETDLKKRLREKLNKKKILRMNNNKKQEYIDKQESKNKPVP
jgi:hypothetical protein